jgi:tetratricopeptide (TPR) repeat protein
MRQEQTADVHGIELYRRFRDLRERRGLTKTAVAQPRYTVSYVSQIESGRRRPSPEALEFFAGRLGVSSAYLATGVPEQAEAHARLTFEQALRAVSEGRAAEGEALLGAAIEEADRYGFAHILGVSRIELGRALTMQGRLGEAVESLESALDGELFERDRGRATASLAVAYRGLGDFAYAADLVEGYLQGRRGHPLDPSIVAELQSVLLSIYYERGDMFRAELAGRRAVAASEVSRDPEARATALWNTSRLLSEASRFEEALEYAGKARVLMEELDQRRNVARLHNAYAFLCLETEPPRVEEARDHLAKAGHLLEEMSAPADLALVQSEWSRLALYEERFDDALASAERAIVNAAGDAQEVAKSQFLRGRALVGLGREGDAFRAFEAAAELFASGGARQQEAGCWREIGELHLQEERMEEGIDALRRGLDLLAPRRSRA